MHTIFVFPKSNQKKIACFITKSFVAYRADVNATHLSFMQCIKLEINFSALESMRNILHVEHFEVEK